MEINSYSKNIYCLMIISRIFVFVQILSKYYTYKRKYNYTVEKSCNMLYYIYIIIEHKIKSLGGYGMKLTFLGATHEVTGSCFYLEACGKKVVIDCGMEQGPDIFENNDIPVGANAVDYVLLTHAHIDHSGKLPLLYKNGFSGQIHATDATSDLCNIMLRDSAHIQEFEAEWRNRKGKRAGRDEYVPLYTMDDALGAISLFVPHKYKETFSLCDGIEVRFTDVGHLLGSSSIEIS